MGLTRLQLVGSCVLNASLKAGSRQCRVFHPALDASPVKVVDILDNPPSKNHRHTATTASMNPHRPQKGSLRCQPLLLNACMSTTLLATCTYPARRHCSNSCSSRAVLAPEGGRSRLPTATDRDSPLDKCFPTFLQRTRSALLQLQGAQTTADLPTCVLGGPPP